MLILSTIALVVGVVDIILQLVLGRDAINRDGWILTSLAESFMWWADLHVYAFTGKGGGFEFFPSTFTTK